MKKLPTITKRVDENWAGGSDEQEVYIFETDELRDLSFDTFVKYSYMEDFSRTDTEISYYNSDRKFTFQKSEIEINDGIKNLW